MLTTNCFEAESSWSRTQTKHRVTRVLPESIPTEELTPNVRRPCRSLNPLVDPGGMLGHYSQSVTISLTFLRRTEDKIAALEAKLTQMQSDDKPKPSTLVGHPSLPLKPPAPLPNSVVEMEKSHSKFETHRRNNNTDKARASRAEPMQMSGKGAKLLGKKPTLQELMNSTRSGSPATSQGLFRR